MSDSLTAQFKVTSHILEDLGLTLYTSLSRVLVEFVANAYDADAQRVEIDYDPEGIEAERLAMRRDYQSELVRAKGGEVKPLDIRVLPDTHGIVIRDDGHGMSRSAIEEKFLVAGRRRLVEDPDEKGRSPNGRPLMGRKGLGKLAGFGVAKLVTVTSRARNEPTATQVELDFDDIHRRKYAENIDVPLRILEDGGNLPKTGGTEVRLSRLLHAPTKNRQDTIINELVDHFSLINPDEFTILLAGNIVEPDSIKHAYAWPNPDLDTSEFVDCSYETESGQTIKYRYRLRFAPDKKALPASRRGVRVYTNGRLCAAPSLLDADTNMHGFRMVDYLDGVVHADFIADEQTDYIATDRQGLRWEAPILEPMYKTLSEEIKTACARYQAERDRIAKEKIEEDDFTTNEIAKAGLSGRDIKTAKSVATLIARGCKEGVGSSEYKNMLPPVIQSIGHGKVLTAITNIAAQPFPDIDQLIAEATRLTHDELGRFMSTVKGRLAAIEALRKIVMASDFANKNNESEIQELLEESPWLIDPTYTQFLSANQRERTLFKKLAKELEIGDHAQEDGSSDRPDLVFLIGNESLQRLVIVELKAANTPLDITHLLQLKSYLMDAEKWLRQNGKRMDVRGILIGSRAKITSKAKGVRLLNSEEDDNRGRQNWEIKDYVEVLDYTEAAHAELWNIHKDIEASATD